MNRTQWIFPRSGPLRNSVACIAVLFCATTVVADDTGLRVANGFQVSRFAADELAHDIFSMTVDAQGRLVVSGPGYVRTLIDDDRDGQADRAVQFSDRPSTGAQGLLFLGNDLLFTGDGGLWLLRDKDADGVADSAPERWLKLNNGEHGAHGLTVGPDGWIYVMCGNDAGMSSEQVTDPNSPITNPVAGCVVRIRPDGQQVSIVAHGFRNAYDLGFNAAGCLFTVDSDGERSHHLPWYTPTRLFDISLGEQHGWVLSGWQRSWSRPEYFFDNVPRVCELGRGSPSGLVVYRHQAFPAKYRDGVFTACWTLGRVYFVGLHSDGVSYKGQPEVFLETEGDLGFAPVDLAVGPEGELYVAVGGRGTEGGIFCVKQVEDAGRTTDGNSFAQSDVIDKVLNANQPLSSWSRANWLPLASELPWQQLAAVAMAADDLENTPSNSQRVRAIEVLVELHPNRIAEVIDGISVNDAPQVVARLAWAIAETMTEMHADEAGRARAKLAEMTHLDDLFIQRAAWEALGQFEDLSDETFHEMDWVSAYGSPSRRVRHAALQIAAGSAQAAEIASEQISKLPPADITGRIQASLLWARSAINSESSNDEVTARFQNCLELMQSQTDPEVRLEVVRLIEILLGDIQAFVEDDLLASGYSLARSENLHPVVLQELRDSLASLFPSGNENLDREASRLLAMIGSDNPHVPENLSKKWTTESSPVDDVHYFTVMAKLDGPRSPEVTARTAAALVRLHKKLAVREWYPSREWPIWLTAVFDELIARDEALPAAMLSDVAFGEPDHAMYVLHFPAVQRALAARRLFDQLDDESYEEAASVWTDTLIEAIEELPDDVLFPKLRDIWDEALLRGSIVSVLSRSPDIKDRARYIETLKSGQPPAVEVAVAALVQLSQSAEPNEVAAAIRRLQRSCQEVGSPPEEDSQKERVAYERMQKVEQPMREQLDRLLTHWSQASIEVTEDDRLSLIAQYEPWFQWFRATYPESNGIESEAVASQAWAFRLTQLDWEAGNVNQGESVYRRKLCSQCHDGNARLGPKLAPAVKRLTREDLFRSVIYPSENISPQYRGTQVVTRDGRVYQGLPVYDSPEGLLLRTGAATTVRLTGEQIELRNPSTRSFMPQGLLDDLSDSELAHLYAYLRTLD